MDMENGTVVNGRFCGIVWREVRIDWQARVVMFPWVRWHFGVSPQTW
jgi:hypothetical protein